MNQIRYNGLIIFFILITVFLYPGCSQKINVKETGTPLTGSENLPSDNQDIFKQEPLKNENENKKPDPFTPISSDDKPEIKKTSRDAEDKIYYQQKRSSYPIKTVPASSRQNFQQDNSPGNIVFNFDNADLYEVIRTMAELLKINYIVDPGVKGSVTIHTSGNLKKEDIFSVFFQVLDANGLTAVKDGTLYKIIPIKDTSRIPGLSSDTRGEIPPEERVVMQIIPLNHISASEMTKLLTPFVSKDGTILSHENSRTLLLVDKAKNILKAIKLVNAFDIDIFQTLSYRLYSIKNVDAEEMVKLLDDILSAYGEDVKKI
ncbi:NolW domain-containig [Desulfonema limicola]|uniref:NolW domain-containig n=1 Tax=Desulfonema limicola TaxID=45656 RepID=A0A975B861_9BACT|nr:secretin N-terminal domain-containing protein [Desulfonema limicola]QTA80613.1 NolW domain-containig [Desulfonema limicola]